MDLRPRGRTEGPRPCYLPDSIEPASGRWHRRLVWFVYILRCSDNSLYIGGTDDVAARVSRHNDGRGSSFTASRRPVRLVWSESQESREDALERERQLKGWTRAKKEALITGDMAGLRRASEVMKHRPEASTRSFVFRHSIANTSDGSSSSGWMSAAAHRLGARAVSMVSAGVPSPVA